MKNKYDEILKPKMLDQKDIDLSTLIDTCKQYINALVSGDLSYAKDIEEYIYEDAMITLYGKEIFDWINRKEAEFDDY